MLEVSNLSFNYRGQVILDQLGFDIADNEIVGLVAPNGTGKSTLLRNLTGLLKPKSGVITLNQFDSHKNRTDFLQNLFFLEDNRCLYEHLTAIEQIEYIKAMWHSNVDVSSILALLGMTNYQKKRISRMSLGMRQHVLLACYLAANTPLMLFDEPLNGLDPTSVQMFKQIFTHLKQQGHSIIMSSHSVDNIAAMTDRVFFLNHGHISIYPTAGIDLLKTYNKVFEVKPLDGQFQI